MPNIGPLELAIVLLIILVIFGPKRLPGLGRQLGTGMREFKDSVTGRGGGDDRADDHADDHADDEGRRHRRASLPPASEEAVVPPTAEGTLTPEDGGREDAARALGGEQRP
jgi:sec-independent protein translocase protein TatA